MKKKTSVKLKHNRVIVFAFYRYLSSRSSNSHESMATPNLTLIAFDLIINKADDNLKARQGWRLYALLCQITSTGV